MAKVMRRSGMGANELFQALSAGDEQQALDVLRAQPELARTRDDDGLSPLMQAVYRGFDKLAEILRAERGDPDVLEAAAIGDLNRLRELAPDKAGGNAWGSA